MTNDSSHDEPGFFRQVELAGSEGSLMLRVCGGVAPLMRAQLRALEEGSAVRLYVAEPDTVDVFVRSDEDEIFIGTGRLTVDAGGGTMLTVVRLDREALHVATRPER